MNDLSADLTMPKPVRFTAAEFVRMGEAGVFERFAKTELIDGEVLSMNAQHRRHSRVKNDLVERMRIVLRQIAPDVSALSEVSVDLSPGNVPEPDIVVLEDDGGDDLVPAARVRLVVEVADASLAVDLGRKARIYAAWRNIGSSTSRVVMSFDMSIPAAAATAPSTPSPSATRSPPRPSPV